MMPSKDDIQRIMLEALPHHHEHEDLVAFYQYLRDYPQRGGKMLRGQILLLATEAHGQAAEKALSIAAALELFQNWVLIHDDIEDDSDERRGQPALHKNIGMPVALNVGDALHVYMWQLLHHLESFHLEQWRAIIQEFEWMIHRTAEGQHLDLSWIAQDRFDVSESDYLQMVQLKTSYYTVVCPLRLGAICADISPHHELRAAGEALGIAFQIRDDVLNLIPNAQYGKEYAGDLYEAKRTLILAHLFSQVSSSEHQELIERLQKPRSQKTDHDRDRILHFIHTYQSLDYAQDIADKKAQEGLEKLREALPLTDQALELTRLLETLASRMY